MKLIKIFTAAPPITSITTTTLIPTTTFTMSGIDHLGKDCNRDSFYTLTSDLTCDGWPYISYEDCKRKCVENELPANCENHPDVIVPSSGCLYASWYISTQWCHLAGNDCILSQDIKVNVWEKPKIPGNK